MFLDASFTHIHIPWLSTIAHLILGDWVTVGTDGSVQLDVRFIMTTDDGATILVKVESGRSQRDADNPMKAIVHGAGTYETGDERYKYLNNKVYVFKGVKDGNELKLNYFQLV